MKIIHIINKKLRIKFINKFTKIVYILEGNIKKWIFPTPSSLLTKITPTTTTSNYEIVPSLEFVSWSVNFSKPCLEQYYGFIISRELQSERTKLFSKCFTYLPFVTLVWIDKNYRREKNSLINEDNVKFKKLIDTNKQCNF